MQFERLCNWICFALSDQLLLAGIRPNDRGSNGKANLDGRFGGLVVWDVPNSGIEHRFEVFVKYAKVDGKVQTCGVTVTFEGKDPHEYKTQAEFKAGPSQEWVTACIKS